QQVVGTVQNATAAVTDTVETVKDAVQGSVQVARESVQNTVEAVKDTFDVSLQVQRHPWLMMAGSVALGYAGGCLLNRTESRPQPRALASLSTLAERSAPERDGGRVSARREVASPVTGSTRRGLFGELGEMFESELSKLKGLALGTMLGAVRDMVASSAPP